MRFRAPRTGNAPSVGRLWSGGLVAGAAVAVLAGCDEEQATITSDSPAARSISTLWWILFTISTVVVAVVTLLVLISLLKRRGRLDRFDRRDAPRARNVVLISGAVAPAVILVALFIYVLATVDAT